MISVSYTTGCLANKIKFDKVLLDASSDTSIVISARYAYYLTGVHFESHVASELNKGSSFLAPTNPQKIMNDFVFKLLDSDAKIFLVEPVPELSFEPQLLLGSRLSKLYDMDYNRVISKDIYLSRNKHFYSSLVNLPVESNVEIVKISSVLCSEYCFVTHDSDLLYRDNNHLSVNGFSHLLKNL